MKRAITLLPALSLSFLLAGTLLPVTYQSPTPRVGNAFAQQAETGLSLQSERDLAWMVSEPRMQGSVRHLCSLGPRMGGTRSNDASASWLAAEFRRAGLEVEIREDAPTNFHEEEEWEVTVVGSETLGTTWPYGGSPPVDGTGPLSATAGEGVVWLTSDRLQAESAAGCLAVLSYGRTSPSGWPTAGSLRGEWSVPVFGISTSEAETLSSLLAEDPGTEVRVKLVSRTGRGNPKTVVATLPGRDRSRHMIFCAHGDSDSGGPGADDNASGVAIVLEVARVISDALRLGLIEQPAYDIRFIPWGVEIRSTREYIQKTADEESILQAVFNFDQSGFGSWKDALYFEPDDVPVNEEIIKFLRSVASDHLGQPGFPERFASTRSQGGTDSYAFQSERLVGENVVPSVTIYTSAWATTRTLEVTPGFPPVNWYEDEEEGMVTVDGDAYYHSAGDTPENTTDLEPWNMGWCARVSMIAALRLMGM